MHQFIRIPVDQGLMAKELSVEEKEEQSKILTKWKETGSGSEGLSREQITRGFVNVGLWCWTLASIVCLASFLCYLHAAVSDVKDFRKKEIDKACGAELFRTVYDHFVLHIFSFLFMCFVAPFIFEFEDRELDKPSKLQKTMPLSMMMVPVVLCLGYIIAFGYMAGHMEGRFQEASKNEKCMNAVHGFGRWGEAYRLDVLRNMYLVADVLWCVCYFLLLCAACLMGAYSREW
jgi:hypothetical protein